VKEIRRRVTAEDITADLIEEAAAGVRGAAGILADFIYGWVQAVLKGSPDVDDATQEAFLAVLDAVRRRQFKIDSGKPSSWVAKVSVNRAIDFHRRQQWHLKKFDHGAVLEDVQNPNNFDIDFTIDVKSAANTLDKEERALLLLRYYENLSIEEVAEVLSIPVGTVKSRTFRAQTKLTNMLHSQKPGPHLLSMPGGKT
jgi:RNA polymerase sigma-70 factor, ECF subfamily